MKVKANIRFVNSFDGKIYDKDDQFEAKEADAKYLIDNKIASEVKTKETDKTEKKYEEKEIVSKPKK